MDATTKVFWQVEETTQLAQFTPTWLILLARPERFELPTPWFVVRAAKDNFLIYRNHIGAPVAKLALLCTTMHD